MVMENQPTKSDWIVLSPFTILAACGLVGLVTFGAMELVTYDKSKFCKQYGWLKNEPTSSQESVADARAREIRSLGDSQRMS